MFELLIEPFAKEIIVAIISVLTAGVSTLVGVVVRFVLTKIASVKNANNRDILERIARDAYALVKQTMEKEKNQDKIAHAIQYVSDTLKNYKINMTPQEIRAAIEKVVVDNKR